MKNLIDQTSIVEVLKIPLTIKVQDEVKEVSSLNYSGKYSVKITYQASIGFQELIQQKLNSVFKPLWSLKIHD